MAAISAWRKHAEGDGSCPDFYRVRISLPPLLDRCVSTVFISLFTTSHPSTSGFAGDITFSSPTEEPDRGPRIIKLESQLARRLHDHEQACRAEYGEGWASPYLLTIRDWHWDAVEEARNASRLHHALRRKIACLHQEIDFFQASASRCTSSEDGHIPEIFLLDALARGTAVITGAA